VGARSKLVGFQYVLYLYGKNATKPSLSVCIEKLRRERKRGVCVLGRGMRYQEKNRM